MTTSPSALARLRAPRPVATPAAPAANGDQWLHRPDVWAGLVLGAALAEQSFHPSLMPRATAHQALIAGVSGALGFGVGNATYGLAARTGHAPADLAVLGGTAAAGFALSRVLPEHDGEASWHPALRSAGSIAAAGSVAGMVGVALRSVPAGRRAPVGGVVVALALASGARAVYQGVKAQRDAHTEYDPQPPRPLPAVTQSVGVGAVLVAVTQGFRKSAGGLGSVLHHRLGVPATPSRWLGRGLALGIWYGTGKALADNVVSGLRTYDRVVDAGFDRAPDTPLRSAGPGSPIAFARLGREGRRIVRNVPGTDDIERVMGRPAVAEPIRLFVGYAAARTDEERVALAVEELRRTGAFDRSLLVVGCPAGNGYVNSIPLEVCDYAMLGDTAFVAVQYGRLPSFLTLRRVVRGGDIQGRLLEAIRDELVDRPADRRPRVVLYGESLGAWAGQDTFLHTGLDRFDELGVDRALWAGTPYYSGWRREVLVDRSVAVPEGAVVEVEGPAGLTTLDDDARDRLRVVVVGHGNDPVRYISFGMFVRRPDWLGHDRPWGVPDNMNWIPGVTAVQVLMDAVNATRPVPGVFRATGHEYNADLPEATLHAYALPRPDPAVWDGLVAHLQAVDKARFEDSRLPRRAPAAEGAADGAAVTGTDAPGKAHGRAAPGGRRRGRRRIWPRRR